MRSDCPLDLGTDYLVGNVVFVSDASYLAVTPDFHGSYSLQLCCDGHDSQAYRKMDVTRDRISRIVEVREMLLSFQTSLNLVNAVFVCAILENISGLESS